MLSCNACGVSIHGRHKENVGWVVRLFGKNVDMVIVVGHFWCCNGDDVFYVTRDSQCESYGYKAIEAYANELAISTEVGVRMLPR